MLFCRFDENGVERSVVDFDDTFVLRDIADVSIFVNEGIGDIIELKKWICTHYDFLCVWKGKAFPIKKEEKVHEVLLEQAMRNCVRDNLCWKVK